MLLPGNIWWGPITFNIKAIFFFSGSHKPPEFDRLFDQGFEIFLYHFHSFFTLFIHHSVSSAWARPTQLLWTSPNHSCAPEAWLMKSLEILVHSCSDRKKSFILSQVADWDAIGSPAQCRHWDWFFSLGIWISK